MSVFSIRLSFLRNSWTSSQDTYSTGQSSPHSLKYAGAITHHFLPLSLGHRCGLQVKGLAEGDLVLLLVTMSAKFTLRAAHLKSPRRHEHELHAKAFSKLLPGGLAA